MGLERTSRGNRTTRGKETKYGCRRKTANMFRMWIEVDVDIRKMCPFNIFQETKANDPNEIVVTNEEKRKE